MEKRLALALALSAFILFGWMFVQQRYFPAPPPPAVTPTAQTPEPAPVAPPAAAGKEGAPAAQSPSAPRPPEERVTVERPHYYRATFTSWGAAPTELTLLNPQYKVTVDGHDVPINLVRPEAMLPYATSFAAGADEGARSEFDLPGDAAWTLARKTDDELVYATDVAGLHVEKKWTLPREGYRLGLEVSV